MRKKLINEKRDGLKELSRKELIDRILAYPDRDALNVDVDGNKRQYPIGKMASAIQSVGYQMSDAQYYTLIHHFAEITVPEMRVVGVTFQQNDPNEFEKTKISKEGTKSVYEMDYLLRPEPTNPHDKNAVMVLCKKTDGELHQIGYLNREFVAAYQITEDMTVKGYLTDWSNDHLNRVSYSLALDIEALKRRDLTLTEEDLAGLEIAAKQEPHVYETKFQLTNPVINYEEAKAFLTEDDMTSYLKDSIENNESFRDAILHTEWELEDENSGTIMVVTNRELTPEESAVVSDWILGQNSDGLGESFEQQSFASYEEQNADDYGFEDDDYDSLMGDSNFIMASFDWETNKYELEDVTERRIQETSIQNILSSNGISLEDDKKDVTEQTTASKPDLTLTEADLEFGRQMELSDFGIM